MGLIAFAPGLAVKLLKNPPDLLEIGRVSD